MATRNGIENYLDTLLNADGLEDYGPNGWRVEGRAVVRRIVSGVTASLAWIDARFGLALRFIEIANPA